jgi:hypothetical protein
VGSKHISQGRLGTFPKEKFCVSVLIFIVVVGGRTVRIRTVRTARKEGTNFEAGRHKIDAVLRVFLLQQGRTDQSYNRLWACFPRCCFLGGSYSSTDLAHFPRQNLWGQNLGDVSGFLLLLNCNFADILS